MRMKKLVLSFKHPLGGIVIKFGFNLNVVG